MGRLLLLLILSATLSSSSWAELKAGVGINYGQLGNNLPSAAHAAHLICHTLKASRVKIYDANPDILRALATTGLEVSMQLPNELIHVAASNQSFSDEWVRSNVAPFYPNTRIQYILIGNEVLSNNDIIGVWPDLVPAMKRIQASLAAQKIKSIKVTTSLAIDTLESSLVFPPSNASFRADLSVPIMKPMLEFIRRTGSVVFLDVYPYFHWIKDPRGISLDYVLFEGNGLRHKDPGSGLVYDNFFDQMVDSVYFALEKLGFPKTQVFIAETGWPSGGDYDEIGANIYNAATYNRNVVKKLMSQPPVGTPARPGRVLPGLIFALFNENQKVGPATERQFGLLYPNGSTVYKIDLSGKTAPATHEPLPKPNNNKPYKGKVWCVAVKGANMTELKAALSETCSKGNETCNGIRPGSPCYRPDSINLQASYAFSSFWAQARKLGVTCFFKGLAAQTIKDPSYGTCKFPSVLL